MRALEAAGEAASALRAGLPPEEARGYVLRIANAVDRSLRRLLRDDERADLPVRLSALAPDEIDAESVLRELRRNERLSLETGAAVHELYELRRRLEGGLLPDPDEVQRTAALFGRLSSEIGRAPVPTPAFVASSPLPKLPPEPIDSGPRTTAADSDFDLGEELPPIRSRRARRAGNTTAIIAVGAVLLLLAIILLVRGLGSGAGEEMERGIALFRTGEYAEAAQHFWRYAEANPDDATPHLYLARIHRRMERPELAAEAIREAQERAPEDPAVHRELGFLLLDTGQTEAAIQRFRTSIEMAPESAEGYVGLVRALRDAGREEEVPDAIAAAPADVRALLQTPASP